MARRPGTRPLAPFAKWDFGSTLSRERMDAVVERRWEGETVYQLEHVKCSSRGCWCQDAYPEKGHGPYWYAYELTPRTKRWRVTYIGKTFRRV